MNNKNSPSVNRFRLGRFFERAEEGSCLTIAFLGGSITQGSLATKAKNTYAARVFHWYEETFPDSVFSYINRGLETDGEISPSPAYKYMLEFVGDSITSGEGAIGAQTEEEWISAWFSSVQTFPFLTAQRLGAEYRIISQSGWGISRDWAGDKNNVLPRIYDRTAYPGFPEKRYDFSREPAGAVIINLGTNDAQPRADLAAVKEKGLAFLKEVRTKNPGAVIVWCYGMLGSGRCGSTDMKETLEDMIAAYRSESGDERVFYLQLPNTEGEDLGARSHPGLPSHAKAADVLSAFLQKVLP